MERVEEVFRELNYPSAVVLKKALRNREIPFDTRAVDQLVRGEIVRQVQAPKYRLNLALPHKVRNQLALRVQTGSKRETNQKRMQKHTSFRKQRSH